MNVLLLSLLFLSSSLTAAIAGHQDAEFEWRRQRYIDSALNRTTGLHELIFRAKRKLVLPETPIALDNVLKELPRIETSDFRIVKLVRLLFYTRAFDDRILPVLRAIPLWLTPGESLRCYWSENHMIMWSGSAWLLKERDPTWPVDPYLRQRLIAFLELKIQYGFYEFFSNNYFRFTLSGLLNLADFAQDREIRDKATVAVTRLITQMLLGVNDKGSLVAANGRNSPGMLKTGHDGSISLLTGRGRLDGSHGTVFLATTNVDLSSAIRSWKPAIDTMVTVGHSYRDTAQVFAALPKHERIVFQWSFGGYFPPELARESVWLIRHYQLDKHGHWNVFSRIPNFLDWITGVGAKIGAPIARSSVLTGPRVSLYRNSSSALSSIQNYFGGYVGWQQNPWVASTGTISVFAQTGSKSADHSDRAQNSYLPRVFQKRNVILIMYRQMIQLKLLSHTGVMDLSRKVSLHFPRERFDQVAEDGYWTFGREKDSYVAIRRHCHSRSMVCDHDGQTWAVVVGNSKTHVSFEQFQSVITTSSSYMQKWKRKSWYSPFYDYYAELQVDGVTLSHTWK